MSLSATRTATITATAVAASVAVSGGGTAGVAVAGGGAQANNVILGNTEAYVTNSVLWASGAFTLTASDASSITATIAAVAASGGGGGTGGVAAAIGASLAENLIGFNADLSTATNQVLAYVQDSSIHAGGALMATATAGETINATVVAASAAISGGGTVGVSLSGSGVSAINEMGTDVKAYIDGDTAASFTTAGIVASSISLTAKDTSGITVVAGAASIAGSVAGTAGVALSIGVALAQNRVGNEVEAYIADVANSADAANATAGGITLEADEAATIQATSAAASLAVGIGGTAGVSVSGAGAAALNTILTADEAYVLDSTLVADGAVSATAHDSASITATIAAASAAVGGGGTAGVGASLGVALARNFIGWDPTLVSAQHTSDQTVTGLSDGTTVRVVSGVHAGDVYRYVGTPLSGSVDLSVQNYQNTGAWQPVAPVAASAQVLAYVQDSSVTATGALSLTATSSGQIMSTVIAGSVAVAGGTVGIGAAGAGVGAQNTVAETVNAYISGTGGSSISAASATLRATDSESIMIVTGAASIAGGFGGGGGALTIGVAIAINQITDDVEAYISGVPSLSTNPGGVSLTATDSATISATSAAASLGAAIGGTAGIAVSGAGADATNVILGSVLAHIDSSAVHSVGGVSLGATDSSQITAIVVAASVAAGGGGSTGVGASLGAAISQNLIGWTAGGTRTPLDVGANITASTISSGGTLSESATDSATISATVTSGSVAIAGGADAGVGLGGAGSGVLNEIAIQTTATITGSTSAVHAAGITQSAMDTSSITAVAGSAALAAAFGMAGVGLSVSADSAQNEISNVVTTSIDGVSSPGVSTQAGHTNTETAANIAPGDTVLVTGPPAANFTATAGAPNVQNVTPGQVVTLSSSYGAGGFTTDCESCTVSPGIRVTVLPGYTGGGTPGTTYAYAGTGTSSLNLSTQDYTSNAWTPIGGSSGASYVFVGSGAQGHGLDLNAQDYANTQLWQQVIGTVGSAYVYTGQAGTLNLGAQNYGNTSLWQPVTLGGITATATEGATISATATAASAAIGGGFVGVSFAASGANAQNVILTQTTSFINASNVTTTGGVSLSASDTASISAIVVSVSAAFAGGAGAGGAAIGSSSAENLIGYNADQTKNAATVLAYVTASSVGAGGSVTLRATSSSTIKADVAAGAVAIAGGDIAVAGAGAGEGMTNLVDTRVQAYISNTTGTGVTAGGAVSLAASDTSSITSLGIAAAISAAFGAMGSGAASVGVAIAINTVSNDIEAYVSAAKVTTATGGLSIMASETATISSTSAAAAVAVAIGPSLAGGGASDSATENDTIKVRVTGSTLSLGGGLTVGANDSSSASATVSATAGSIGFSAAGGVANARVTPTVQASIDSSSVTAAGNIVLSSNALDYANASTFGNSFGAFAAAGSNSTATIAPQIQTFISGNSVTSTGGGISLSSEYNAKSDGSSAATNSAPLGAVAYAEAGSGGIIAGSGANATATDSASVQTYISGGAPSAQGAISLLAASYSAPSATTTGIAGGAVGVGSSTATATANGATAAYVSTTVRGGASLTVTALNTEAPQTNALAVSGGIISGSGSSATSSAVADGSGDPAATAYLGTGEITVTGAVAVQSTFNLGSYASATGGSYGGVSVGASIASSTTTADVTATVPDGANINAGSLSVTATRGLAGGTGTDSSHANSDASSGALIGVDASTATASAEGNVTARIGAGVTLPSGAVAVMASDTTGQEADASGFAAGVIGAGASIANATSKVVTSATLGANPVTDIGRTGSLTVQAAGTDYNTANTMAGSGGVVSGNASEGTTEDTSSVTATITAPASGAETIHSGAVTVDASHISGYLATANSVQASVVGGSGATATATATTPVETDIGANITFLASHGIAITAENRFVRLTSTSDTVSAASGGGITATAAISSTTLTGTTTVHIMSGVNLTVASSSPLSSDGILISASNTAPVADTIDLTTGGAIDGAGTEADMTVNETPTVTIDSGGSLVSNGNIAVGTYATSTASTSAGVDTWGLAAVGVTHANTTVDATQTVTIGGPEMISALGNATLTAGGDPAGAFPTTLSANSAAEGYVRGLIAIPVASAHSHITSVSTLTVSQGVTIVSGENTTLESTEGVLSPVSDGTAHGYELGFIPVTNHDGNTSTSGSSATFTMNGTATAGVYHVLSITITDCGSNTNCNPVSVAPGGFPFLSSFCNPASPSTTACNDTGGFSPDLFDASLFPASLVATVNAGVSTTDVGAVILGPLFASGGLVTVDTGTIAGSGSLSSFGTPSITVDNESPYYLITGLATIPDIPGGAVVFTGAAQGSDATHAGLSCTPNCSAQNGTGSAQQGAITIENTFTCTLGAPTCVGTPPTGSAPLGPALYDTGDLNNLGGAIDIVNNSGSFFKAPTASIFGQSVNMNIPNGEVVLPEDPSAPFVGSNPYSEWMSQLIWPGNEFNPSASLAVAWVANYEFPGFYNSTCAANPIPCASALTTDLIGFAGTSDGASSDTSYVFYGYCNAFADSSDLQSTCPAGVANSLSPLGQSQVISNSDFDQRSFPLVPAEPLSMSLSSYGNIQSQLASEGTLIYGGRVTITGSIIDLDAKIVAGQSTDWSLELPSSLDSFITLYKFFYSLGVVGPTVALPVSADVGTAQIGATYDARNGGQIIVNDVDASSGSSSIVIDGGLMSTNPIGDIHVNGGLGTININNQTGIPLTVQNLYAGSTTSSVASTVEIIDTALVGSSRQSTGHTLYVYQNGHVSTYVGGLDSQGNPLQSVTELEQTTAISSGGTTVTYDPLAGQRWDWKLTATLNRAITGQNDSNNYTVGQWNWTSNNPIQGGPWQYCTSSLCGIVSNEPAGWLVTGSSDPNVFDQTITASVDLTPVFASGNQTLFDGWTISYHGCGPTCHFGFSQNASGSDCAGDSPCANWTYWNPVDAQLWMLMSVTASNPITVDFSGQSTGTVNVTSDAPVTLVGAITNPEGITTISATGSIIATAGGANGAGGSIASQRLTLIAAGGSIGMAPAPLPVTVTTGGTFTAEGGSAGVYLSLNLATGTAIGGISASDSSGFGDVVVSANGSLTPASASTEIVGDSITLTTGTGSIGSVGAALKIDAHSDTAINGAAIGGVVNASAPGDINLDQVAGDMLVGAITSTGGNVALQAAGSILDASGQTAAQTLAPSQIQAIWHSLGIENSTATETAATTAFVNEVERYYAQYWRLLLNGSVGSDGTYTLSPSSVALFLPDTSTALDIPSPTDAEVASYAAYLYAETVDFFNNVVGPSQRCTGPVNPCGYQEPDGNGLTLVQVGQPLPGFSGPLLGAGWQSSPDFTAFNPNFTFAPTPAESTALMGDALWTANELSYAINQAGLGASSGTPVGVGTPNISARNVTLTAGASIGRLAPPAQITLADLRTGTLTTEQIGALALATAPGDVTFVGTDSGIGGPVSFLIDPASGSLSVAGVKGAAGAIIIQGESADGSLFGVDGAGNSVAVTEVDVAQIAPFFVGALGTLTASAGASAFVQSTTQNLTLDSVTAGTDASITAPGSIRSAGASSPQVTTAGNLTLLAGGDIAASVSAGVASPLMIDVGGVLRSASAGGHLSLEQTTGNLTFDAISAKTDATLLIPAGSLFQNTPLITDIIAPTLTVTASGAAGTPTDPIEVKISGQLNVTAPQGVYIGTLGTTQAPNTLNVESIEAANGPVTLIVQGDTNISSIVAGATVDIFADDGIYEVGDTEPPPTTDAAAVPNITAPSAVLRAGVGIGTSTNQLETKLGTLDALSFGDMWIVNYGDLVVDQIPGFGIKGLTSAGELHLTLHSALTINQPIDSGGFAEVLSAGDGITVNASVTSDGGPITANGGADVSFTANGSFDAGTGTATITAGGSILDAGHDATVDITAAQIALSAAAAIGSPSDLLLIRHTGAGAIGPITVGTGLYLGVIGSGQDSLPLAGGAADDQFLLTPATVAGVPGVCAAAAATAGCVLGANLIVSYSSLGSLNVSGGGGNDTFTVFGTEPGTVTALEGGPSGNDTFNIEGDLLSPVGAGVSVVAPLAGPHDTGLLAGPLIIDGPTSTNPLQTTTLNVFDDLSATGQTGSLSATAVTGNIAGLSTGGGISYTGIDAMDVMLGAGNDTFVVNGTVPGSITVIQGGGGSNDLIAGGGGGPQAPLILFAGTSQNGGFYTSTGANLTGGARIYTDPGGASVLDARNDANSVALYGGTGDVTIYGGGGGDQIAGGSGTDVIFAGSGNDDIYGNAGFNVDLSRSLAQSIAQGTQILSVVNDPSGPVLPTTDPLTASSQTIFAGAGNDIIIGHHGVIAQAPGTNRLLTTGGVTAAYSIDPNGSANDQIYGGAGSAIVIAGNGNDLVNLTVGRGLAPNVVIGDDGLVEFAAPEYFQTVGGWFSNLALVQSSNPHYGGSDRIVTGRGPAIVIGGAGNNFIKTGGGAVILGNDGFVRFSNGVLAQAVSANPWVSAHNPLAGNTIITGPGDSQIIGGSGNNTINVGAGGSVVIAANGEIDYDSNGRPVVAEGRFPGFAGTSQVTIAGRDGQGAPGTKGVVILPPGSGSTVSAPTGYLVVGSGGRATNSTKHHRWGSPKALKHPPRPTRKHKGKPSHKRKAKHKGKPGHKSKTKHLRLTVRHRVHKTK